MEQHGRVYVTGDTHGEWMQRLGHCNFPEQDELTKDDYVIICGDFGLWSNVAWQITALDALDKLPFTTLFVDGNHENFQLLNTFPTAAWNGGSVHVIRPSVLHLQRGCVFTIARKKFFTFGGARSVDMDRREPGISWWPEELPTQEEMDLGEKNLEAHSYSVDFIITHDCPTSTLFRMYGNPHIEMLNAFLQVVDDTTEYRKWYFGHHHIDAAFTTKIGLYRRIERIV